MRLFVPLMALALLGAGCAQSPFSVSSADLSAERNPQTGLLSEVTRVRGTRTLVNPVDLLHSGQGKDGIPALMESDLSFVSVAEMQSEKAFYDALPGIVLNDGTQATFYSFQILAWHEVLEDTFAGEPVVMQYSPFVEHAAVYSRVLPSGDEPHFGVSGYLWNNDSLMYDDVTKTLWSGLLGGRGVYGDLAGETLTRVPSSVMAWGAFRAQYPEGRVLSTQTGYERVYTLSPYGNYKVSSQIHFPRVLPEMSALSNKAVVYGAVVTSEDGTQTAKAYEEEAFARRGLVLLNEQIGEQPVVVWIGSGGVFHLHARTADQFFTNVQGNTLFAKDGSKWTLQQDGTLTDGAENVFQSIPTERQYWFAWSSLHRDTLLLGRTRTRGEINGAIEEAEKAEPGEDQIRIEVSPNANDAPEIQLDPQP